MQETSVERCELVAAEMQQRTESEWVGFVRGRKKNFWEGEHLRSWQSRAELTDRLRMGARRKSASRTSHLRPLGIVQICLFAING